METRVSHTLQMDGWFSECSAEDLPEKTGLYLVFGGKPAEAKNRAFIKHLIYIGQAKDIQDRLNHHEKKALFEKELSKGESLYYYCVYLPNNKLDECEGAMIKFFNKHARIINDKCTKSFTASGDVVHIELEGRVPSSLSAHTSFDIRAKD